MPQDSLHVKKRKKNLTMLALIVAWCALIWGITMVKMAHSAEADPRYKTQRENHKEDMERQADYYHQRAKIYNKEMVDETSDVTTHAVIKPGEVVPEGYAAPKTDKKDEKK